VRAPIQVRESADPDNGPLTDAAYAVVYPQGD
jgi:hypothetical protein